MVSNKKRHQTTSKKNDPSVKHKPIEEVNFEQLKYFNQFPFSKSTLNALKSNGFTKPTEIQRLTIKHALLGADIVAEAVTGSGKTLAFLIPLLERLYNARVTTFDGPVAIILTPTRELARQITLVLKRLCSFFKFTLLNIMGGKNSVLKRQEWNTIARANILIGTPGRLAQHQTENPILDLSNLQILVLDEADRLLDPTFRGDVDTIMGNLSPERQTWLFSATQTNTITQLARLCMRDPVMLSTKTVNTSSTPTNLSQSYAIVRLDQKLDILWTFLQSHCKKKTIVFFSTQKQVRYAHELFTQLRPYFRVMQLRGNMNQRRRFQVYDRFAATPQGCVLLATNLAERGLDFPSVDWVVQFDCPRQLDDYVHRVGRTARLGQPGRSIVFLLPSESLLIQLLHESDIELRQQKFPESRMGHFVQSRAASILAAKPEMANAARVAFTAYLRDYILGAGSPNRSDDPKKLDITHVFDPAALPLGAYAHSLGLSAVPELPKRFLQWLPSTTDKSQSNKGTRVRLHGEDDSLPTLPTMDDGSDEDFLLRKPEYASQANRVNTINPTAKLLDVVEDSNSDSGCSDSEMKDEQLVHDEVKNVETTPVVNKPRITRVQRAKGILRRNIRMHSKIEFDTSGQPMRQTVGDVVVFDQSTGATIPSEQPQESRLDVEAEREILRTVVDRQDRKLWKARMLEQNRDRRKKLKELTKKIKDKQRHPQVEAQLDNSMEQEELDEP